MTKLSRSIAIIGGGLSGTLVAIQLLQQATLPIKIFLIERSSEIGRGVAYSTSLDCHLLNVPISGVSLDVTNSDHFRQWLHQYGKTDVEATDFVPRYWFGSYVQDTLMQAIDAAALSQFEGLYDEAVRIKLGDPQAQVYLRSGRILNVDRVVLALGNPVSSDVAIANLQFYKSTRYVSSGWSGSVDHLLEYPSILLLGAGLTAVDWIVALHERRYQGMIHTLSRHGLLPQPHRQTSKYPARWLEEEFPKTALGLLRWTRQQTKYAATKGYDWQAVLDTVRPHVQTLWVNLPPLEKQRFTRHLRPYWDSHRHRIAPQISDIVAHLQACGQLHVHTGRLQNCCETPAGVEVSLRRRGRSSLETLTVGAVINCTGPQFNYRKLPDPLIQSLLEENLIKPNRLALGIDAAPDGAVLNAASIPSHLLYTLGPPRRGELWETTAVTEIRDQAIALSQTLLAVHSAVVV